MKRTIENDYVRVVLSKYEYEDDEKGWDADLFHDSDTDICNEIDIIPLHPDETCQNLKIKISEYSPKGLEKFREKLFFTSTGFGGAMDAVQVWNLAFKCGLVDHKLKYKLYGAKFKQTGKFETEHGILGRFSDNRLTLYNYHQRKNIKRAYGDSCEIVYVCDSSDRYDHPRMFLKKRNK